MTGCITSGAVEIALEPVEIDDGKGSLGLWKEIGHGKGVWRGEYVMSLILTASSYSLLRERARCPELLLPAPVPGSPPSSLAMSPNRSEPIRLPCAPVTSCS